MVVQIKSKKEEPLHCKGPSLCLDGAGGRIRTPDLLITNQLLCQLSYTSADDLKIYLIRPSFVKASKVVERSPI